MKKQLQELTVSDLDYNPVWFFIGEDESDADELTISPASINETQGDYGLIVKCVFKDRYSRQYKGYVNWQAPFSIDAIQPIILLSKHTSISFWYGGVPPKDNKLLSIKHNLKDIFLPIQFESVNVLGLTSITGTLEGLYYCLNRNEIGIIKIDQD